MSSPAIDIRDYLVAQGIGSSGVDLFATRKPQEADMPVADPVATVYTSGGFDPQVNSDRKQYQPTVQVIVTGAVDEYVDAEAFLESIRDELINPISIISGGFTYYGSYQQGDIGSIGYDENGRPELSANFRLYRRKDQ